MRVLLTVLGASAIVAYAITGALFANDAEVAAASGLPLDRTIADMAAAGQPYSPAPGIVFAVIGVLLAAAWAFATLLRRTRLAPADAVALWGGILALGAPAYFMTSFGNLMSVGDTYVRWNQEAAFALASRLYLVSGAALVVAVGALVVIAVGAARRRPPVGRLRPA